MKKEFIFDYNNKENWKGQKRAVGMALQVMMDNTKGDLKVTVSPFKKGKSYDQLKGLYRLLGMIAPVLRGIDPSTYFDNDTVKTIIKDQYGYYQEFKGVRLYKSLADATIEDMQGMIETASSFGFEMGVIDCFLSSEEERALKEFYNKGE